VCVLQDNESVLLQALENHNDPQTNSVRKAGEVWLIHGPSSFVPAIEVHIERMQKSHPLAEQEGIYVRDLKSG
jgi:hypothetical protein